MKILIVDDSSDHRHIMSLLLNVDFVKLVEAENGEEAFHLFQQDSFDLIISDFEMPKGSGLDFLKSVRKVSSVPFILLSGNILMDSSTALECGATAFLQKPYRFHDFYSTLNRIFRNSGPVFPELL